MHGMRFEAPDPSSIPLPNQLLLTGTFRCRDRHIGAQMATKSSEAKSGEAEEDGLFSSTHERTSSDDSDDSILGTLPGDRAASSSAAVPPADESRGKEKNRTSKRPPRRRRDLGQQLACMLYHAQTDAEIMNAEAVLLHETQNDDGLHQYVKRVLRSLDRQESSSFTMHL